VLNHVQDGMEAIKQGNAIPPIVSCAHYYFIFVYLVLGFVWCLYKM